MEGKVDSADRGTELYSVGATFYYLLTGENLFDYRLVHDPQGKTVEIGGAEFKVGLREKGEKLERIAEEVHEKRLKKRLKKVPRKYRKFLNRCLTSDERKVFWSVDSAQESFDRIQYSFLRKVGDSLLKGLKIGIPLTLAISAALFVAGQIIEDAKRETKPTLSELVSYDSYRRFSLEALSGLDKVYANAALYPYMKDLESEISRISSTDKRAINGFKFHSTNIHNIPIRLSTAWTLGTFLSGDVLIKGYEGDGVKRVFPSYVPEKFAIQNDSLGITRLPLDMDPPQAYAQGAMYMKLCFGPESNVADVLAEYFSTTADINRARMESGDLNYLPRIEDRESGTGTLREGYGKHLPPYQQELINKVLAIYMITDDKGEIHYDRIPRRQDTLENLELGRAINMINH